MLQRAKEYLAKIPGGVGAYSESKGAVVLRQHVAKVGLKLDSWGGGSQRALGCRLGHLAASRTCAASSLNTQNCVPPGTFLAGH